SSYLRRSPGPGSVVQEIQNQSVERLSVLELCPMAAVVEDEHIGRANIPQERETGVERVHPVVPTPDEQHRTLDRAEVPGWPHRSAAEGSPLPLGRLAVLPIRVR